jgi:phage terminase large subunit
MPRIPDLTPRPYQLPVHVATDKGIKRAVLVWHRRAGKEITCWSIMVKKAYFHRVGLYIYFFPTSRLGRRILWDGKDKEGRRFIDQVPKEIIDGEPNSMEMKIKLKNGSIIQIMGTDNIINVGINPVGCVFSEFSLQDAAAWNLIRPILRENDGWAIFNFTPRGKNHAYDIYHMAKHNPDWFCQKLSIRETGVLTEEDMKKERDEGMSEQLIQQEYYCSFDQGVEGAFYAKLLDQAEFENRITNVPYDPAAAVDTYWDLGVSDATAILFVQNVGKEIHIIDMYHNEGEGINHYANILKQKADQRKWIYGNHYAPHDIQVRELGHGAQTRWQSAKDLGIKFEIVPNIAIIEGIEMTRNLFPRLWIDANYCKYFLKCVSNYHKMYNEKYNVYSDKPVHDWSSHVADAFRMLGVTTSRSKRERMSEREAQELQNRYLRKF